MDKLVDFFIGETVTVAVYAREIVPAQQKVIPVEAGQPQLVKSLFVVREGFCFQARFSKELPERYQDVPTGARLPDKALQDRSTVFWKGNMVEERKGDDKVAEGSREAADQIMTLEQLIQNIEMLIVYVCPLGNQGIAVIYREAGKGCLRKRSAEECLKPQVAARQVKDL